MTKKTHQSKRELLLILVFILLVQVITIMIFVEDFKFEEIGREHIRPGLILLLSYFVYLEKSWARLIMCYILFFGGILSLFYAITALHEKLYGGSALLALFCLFYWGPGIYIGFVRKW